MSALIFLQLVWLVRQLVRSGVTIRAFVTNSWNAVEIFALLLCVVVVILDAFAVWSGKEVRRDARPGLDFPHIGPCSPHPACLPRQCAQSCALRWSGWGRYLVFWGGAAPHLSSVLACLVSISNYSLIVFLCVEV